MSKTVGMITKLRHFAPYYILRQIYQCLISPYLSYTITVWGSARKCHLNKVLVLQKRALRFMNLRLGTNTQCRFQVYGEEPKAGTGHKMLSVPFFFSMSRFQDPAFGCNKIVVVVFVVVTLLAQMYHWLSWVLVRHFEKSTRQWRAFWGTTGSPIFTRDYFISENSRVDDLERRIYERPLESEPFIENQSEHISKLSLHHSLVKR